jgi:predicted nucleotidyltransferase
MSSLSTEKRLCVLVLKTAGLVVKEVLNQEGVKVAFVFGSLVRKRENAART